MKKNVSLVSMMVVMVLCLVACTDNVDVYDEREPVQITVEGGDAPAYVGMVEKFECGTLVDDTADNATMDLDCGSVLGLGWYCSNNVQASKDLGPTNTCVPGCYAVFSTDTYSGEQSKAYDSCGIVDDGFACAVPQFGGDGKCHKVLPGTTPTETGTTPTPAATTGKLVKTCYALTTAEISVDFGQMSWSEATSADPSKWGSAQDLVIGADGCFSGYLSTYAVGCQVVVDLTVGKHAGKKGSEVQWVGQAKEPTSVQVSGKTATKVSFDPTRGWVFSYC